MSLIDEALKRAREQAKANAEDRSARKSADPWEYAPLPDRRRSVPWPAAAVVILAAVVAGILVVRRGGRENPASAAPGSRAAERVASERRNAPERPTSPPGLFDPSKPSKPAPPLPPSSGPPAKSAAAKIGEIRSAAGGGPAAGSVAPAVPEARVAGTAPPVFRVSNASGSPQIRSDGGAETGGPAPPGNGGRAAEARTFVGSLTAPDGHRVELGGIVFSDTTPAALLNGRVLPVGGVVEGLTVVRIEQGRVELQGEGVTYFLAVR